MSPSPAAAVQHATHQHLHFDDQCPVCEQEIPPERREEVQGRIVVRLREQGEEATAKLREQHSKERQQAEAKAKGDLEAALKQHREASEAREAAVREEEAQRGRALMEERLAQAEATRKEEQEALAQRAALAEARAKEAGEASAALKVEIEAVKHAGAEALEKEKQAAAKREADARAAGKIEAEQAANARIEVANQSAQAAITAANQKAAAAEAAKVSLAQDLNAKVTAAEAAKQAAEQQTEAVKQAQEETIATRLREARDALEKDKSEALLAKDKAQFDERQKWQQKLDELQRKLDNQKSTELGEGAEIKLYEALKQAFPDDNIRRVDKGAAGADIVHEIVESGKICGKIVYDSKNRNAWQNNFAIKLRSDQIAEKADHAILSTNKFPKDARELHMQDGVIIACPARVIVLAELLRGHIVQTHALRLSNDAREAKTEKLYSFITSAQCRQLLESIEELIDKLETIEEEETKSHTKVWAKRGQLLRAILKANGDLRFSIGTIIGGDAEAA